MTSIMYCPALSVILIFLLMDIPRRQPPARADSHHTGIRTESSNEIVQDLLTLARRGVTATKPWI